MSVTGLQLGLRIVLRTFLGCATHGAINIAMEDPEDRRRRHQAREQVQSYRQWLTTQQRNERRQDNSDRRRLVCQHLSNSLCSLTCEWDRWRTAQYHSRETPEQRYN